MTDIARRLARLRASHYMTQRQLAQFSGVGEKSISSFETGERIGSLKLSQLCRILEACDTTLEEFFSTRSIPLNAK